MITIATLTTFFGWCFVVNAALLTVTSLSLVSFRGPISRIHAKMMGMDEADLSRAYFQYLAQFKIAVLVLNITPYLALKLMA